MKSENCAEITDAKRIALKSGLTEPGKHDRHCGFIVPAGILIGLGAGLLVDQLGCGFLIGLGLGIIGSELLPLVRKPRLGAALAGCASAGAPVHARAVGITARR